MTLHAMYTLLKKIYDKSGLKREKKGHRYNKAIVYMFRKRFNTILKLNNEVNSNIAEKLMAHKKGLDGVYLQPTQEECYKEFIKAIPQLTIDDSERKQIDLDNLTQEKFELESKNEELQIALKKVDELWLDKQRMEHVQLSQNI
jgi:integrase/recombinase XerD